MEQEPMVEMIDQRGEEITQNVDKAQEEITEAVEKARSRRRKKWWCLLICRKYPPIPVDSASDFARFSWLWAVLFLPPALGVLQGLRVVPHLHRVTISTCDGGYCRDPCTCHS